jgi:hypothetical protein
VKVKRSNTIKIDLYNLAQKLVASKIKENTESLAALKESVGSETKSTAGDKHETGRAMMHLEQEKVMRQLSNNQKLKEMIDRINPETGNESVRLGALVITNQVRFYIIAGLGQFDLNDEKYYLVSYQSDLVQAFKDKEKDDMVHFKGQSYRIEEIF